MSLFVQEDGDEAQIQEVNDVDVPSHQLEVLNIEEIKHLPLLYQQHIVNDLIHEKDGLLILGKGLGWEVIVASILYTTNLSNDITNKRSVLVVLNANERENHKINQELGQFGTQMRVIGGDGTTSDKRRQIYQEGGIVSVTSRILVVDLLSELITSQEINGLFILHAERIKETSNESFIANLYRDSNDWGSIKAFSDDPESFTGFTPLGSRLRNLKLTKTFLWPRFHVDVIESLSFRNKKFPADLRTAIEVNVRLSPQMIRIQSAIIQCIEQCLRELVRRTPDLATEYWDIENLYDTDFTQKVRLSLDSQWYRLGQTAKQLVYDLAFLKGLLYDLLTKDSLTFYQIVQSAIDSNLKSSGAGTMNLRSMSPWLDSDLAPIIITRSKERALAPIKEEDSTLSYNLEPLPKWFELSKLLDEISETPESEPRILVMAADRHVVDELEYLIHINMNTKRYMHRKLAGYELWKQLSKLRRQLSSDVHDEQEGIEVSKTFKRSREVSSVRRRTRGASSVARVNRLYSADEDNRTPVDIDASVVEQLEQEDDVEIIEEKHRTIKVECFSSDNILQEFKPTHVIFYEPDIPFIRRVENYQATNYDHPAKIYYMYYGSSAEEHRSLAQMKKEKESFTKLIREKANLSKHFETKEDSKFSITKKNVVNTRIAGGQRFQTEDDEFRVIVDVREFNSSLPNLLYRVGSKVIPCMLTIGDYILTPKICVERKAIPDLVQSFKNGRLYNQCEQMFRHYETPVLLIEFDEDKSFSFEPFNETRSKNPNAPQAKQVSRHLQEDIQSKITMLLVSYPKLKIIWSSSPYQTAQIFLELKAGEEPPDIHDATSKGLNRDEEPSMYNEEAIDVLQSIPGINNSNYLKVMKKVENIRELVQLDKTELVQLLGEENGNKAHNFINQQVF